MYSLKKMMMRIHLGWRFGGGLFVLSRFLLTPANFFMSCLTSYL